MKRLITVLVVMIIALAGLTSYNGYETKTERKSKNLIAEVKSEGAGLGLGEKKKKKND
jgi:hypothetical protein